MRYVAATERVALSNGTSIVLHRRNRGIHEVSVEAPGNHPVLIRGRIADVVVQRPDAVVIYVVSGRLIGQPVRIECENEAQAASLIIAMQSALKDPSQAVLQWVAEDKEIPQ